MIKKYILSFDIGASKIAYGAVSIKQNKEGDIRQCRLQDKKVKSDFEIQNFDKIKTPKSRKEVIEKIIEIVAPFLNSLFANKGRKNAYKKIIGVGIGIAGQIDFKRGIVLSSPNMPGWKNIPLKNILEKKLGLSVLIDNDAHCFVLGETYFGAAKKYRHIVGLTVGTGIGGGIIIDGKLYRGKNNLAGEFGHTMVVGEGLKRGAFSQKVEGLKRGLKCSCGIRGHLESYASGEAMESLYKKTTGKKINVLEIEKRAIKGEKSALKIIELTAEMLGEGLSDIINSLNPEIIVIGGGLSKVDLLWKLMIQKMKKRVFHSSLTKTKIVRSRLLEKANLLGAATLFDF